MTFKAFCEVGGGLKRNTMPMGSQVLALVLGALLCGCGSLNAISTFMSSVARDDMLRKNWGPGEEPTMLIEALVWFAKPVPPSVLHEKITLLSMNWAR